MKTFLLGIFFTLAAVIVGGIVLLRGGHINFDADQVPSAAEGRIAMAAVDASTDRRASELKQPLQPTEENLVAGAKIYLNNCAGCHGLPSAPDSQFGRSFYPRVPAFFRDTPDMSDEATYHIVQHGIRWTGMPAWNKILSDVQVRQVVAFLGSIGKLPPSALKELEVSNEGAQPEKASKH